ncbi:MAG: hypothetical protein H8E10_05235 [Desulfobacterales bacterium]|nr:hypothetical protein [Desulfobacterales bacterium]MBL7101237.1 hypothetical protein [Desulfobacteraceae bacterium]MBL7172296.1 hypothetical protein [Desulfobacteraceae bacterium]MBU0736178.1 hypothetical protein [Pseudomonadota bacterium]
MKKITSNILYTTHILLMSLALCLFISTTLAADRVYAMKGEITAIKIAGAIGVVDVSMGKNSPTTGGNLSPHALVKEGTKTASADALELRDGDTVCWKTVDKGCLIVGLTETRK